MSARQSYADMLADYEWSDFMTLTFSRPQRTALGALHSFQGHMRKCAVSLDWMRRRQWTQYARWFAASESGPLNGRWHVHVLAYAVDLRHWEIVSHEWRRRGMGLAWCRDVRAGAGYYITKYIVGKGGEYELAGRWGVRSPMPNSADRRR